jgi:ethanolamine ammonia-lyase small subunit
VTRVTDEKLAELLQLARDQPCIWRAGDRIDTASALAELQEMRAAWDAAYNAGVEDAAKRVEAMELESCFPFCWDTIAGAGKRILALRKGS